MDVHLRVLAGGNAGMTVAVAGPKFYIGRSAECQLRARSDAISRYHCVLVLDDDRLIVCDLGSRNGTYVNGQKISYEMRLQSGDHLKVGPLEFEVLIACDRSAVDGPRVAGETAKLSVDETSAGEMPTGGESGQPSDAENTRQSLQTDEAAAELLRRLRRFRRI